MHIPEIVCSKCTQIRRKFHAKETAFVSSNAVLTIRASTMPTMHILFACMCVHFCSFDLAHAPDAMQHWRYSQFRHMTYNPKVDQVGIYPISFPIIPFAILFCPYIHTISPLTHPVNWGVTSPYLRTQDPLGPVFEEFLEADQRLGQVRTKITGQSGRWNLIKQIGV